MDAHIIWSSITYKTKNKKIYLILKKYAETYYFLEAEKKINWHFHNLGLSRHPELEVRSIKKLPLAS